MLQLLEDLSNKLPKIKIKGRGLTYSVDLSGEVKKEGSELGFQVEGKIRFAVLKSAGTFSSKYNLSNTTPLLEHELHFPNINFREIYSLSEDSITFEKRGKPNSQITEYPESILDPIPLIFSMGVLSSSGDIEHSGALLIGGKVKNFNFTKSGDLFSVILNSKKLFDGSYKNGTALVRVPNFNVKLSVEISY